MVDKCQSIIQQDIYNKAAELKVEIYGESLGQQLGIPEWLSALITRTMAFQLAAMIKGSSAKWN